MTLSRRRVLSAIGLAGAGAFAAPRVLAAEAHLETTTVRLAKMPTICFAPQYVCEDLLRMEGFTDIRYIDTKPSTVGQDLAEGKYDFASNVTAQNVVLVDSGLPITLVAGIHAGCYELFASDGIRSIRDLKGKRVGTWAATDLLEMMAAFVGLDPKKDLTIIDDPEAKPFDQFIKASSMPIWHCRRSRRCCMPAVLARSSCGRPPIGRGRNISAARWPPGATMWPGTRLLPSERSGQC
jgi:NitT/TauT family transport system substrate-binding protein